MLLCAKTARTYGRGIFQYVDLTAPNVAAGKNIRLFARPLNPAPGCKAGSCVFWNRAPDSLHTVDPACKVRGCHVIPDERSIFPDTEWSFYVEVSGYKVIPLT